MTTSTRPSAPEKSEVEALYRVLSPGRDSALTASEVCARIGLPDTENNRRKVRLLAEYSLDYGLAICSGNDGYWLVGELNDVDETCGRLVAQAEKMLRRSRMLRAAAEKMLTQTSLF